MGLILTFEQLRHRTNVNLKDKFRNMVKAGIISEGGSTANEA